jgi:hypothetical protein
MAIGDLVGTLSVPGVSGETFTLASNPGGFFAISGANLVEAINTPNGNYPVSISTIVEGIPITQPFILTFSGPSPPNGPMDFSVPGNIGITGALP